MDSVNQFKCENCAHGKSMFCIHCQVKFVTLPYSNYIKKTTDNTLSK